MKKEIWDMYISPAVGRRNGNAIFISTPQGFNWLYDKYLLGKKDPTWESHTAPAWENKHSYPGGQTNAVIRLIVLLTLASVCLLLDGFKYIKSEESPTLT